MNEYAETAARFTKALQDIASKPQNLDNLESYLANHFEVWLTRYANTPETLTAEIEQFAKMEI